MKILIPAVKVGSFETEIHENFGRAEFFAIVDSENNRLSFISNTAKNQSSGAGVAAAQLCVDKEADVVMGYHFGPKAYQALKAAGIKVLDLDQQKLLKEAYNDYKSGELVEAQAGPGAHH
ncbi:NifB/NifX family molybdenum-iron cluster-binding protein [Halanaerobium sp. Z-7514]|uniref:NifB/NifX family molybdenum-iron cluster-binding protein n=1 Tax=Halanaerobium polyolivorans TaxID=2886943 RepID=A0AAW4X182_9FIRM|nr:NifB/NifX family molybdenum-iron cluster-binding protein [Halanaerobium polyolivorans]MCC3145538.1 NifB/NifX family molybdenum-iron cluster-binding protein [Halanaerobium polyolivorans]